MRKVMAAIFVLAVPGTAVAQDAPSATVAAPATAAAPIAPVSAAELAAARAAYRAWAAQLGPIMSEIGQTTVTLGAAGRRVRAADSPDDMRQIAGLAVARAHADYARLRAQVGALDTPDFPVLSLPPEFHAAALRDETLHAIDQLDAAATLLGPMLEGEINGDAQSVRRALALESSLASMSMNAATTLNRAILAATDPASTDYFWLESSGMLVSITSRLDRARVQILLHGSDRNLANDLAAQAQALMQSVAHGRWNGGNGQQLGAVAGAGGGNIAVADQQLNPPAIMEQSFLLVDAYAQRLQDFSRSLEQNRDAAGQVQEMLQEGFVVTAQLLTLRREHGRLSGGAQ